MGVPSSGLTRRDAIALSGVALGGVALPQIGWAREVGSAALPRRSDVCFSTRSGDVSALSAARAVGATRLEWCYTTNAGFLAQARAAGISSLGGALNNILPDQVGGKTRQVGRITDARGQLVTAPWMRWPGIFWGCMNSPDYRATVLAHARAALAGGVDHFQVDDASGNASAVAWGGCVCAHCRAQAAKEGADLTRDMAAFQRRSTTRFHQDMHAAIRRTAGRRVTFSLNNPHGSAGWPRELFDYGIGEFDAKDCVPDKIATLLRGAEARGQIQLMTLRSRDVALNQRMIAWAYANGGSMIVPWDVYLGSTPTGSDRFSGRPEDYAPLYAFARRLGPMLDSGVAAALPDGAWRSDVPGIAASLRRVAGAGTAVLHLVRWGGDAPARVTIDPARLGASGEGATWSTPGAADRALVLEGGMLSATMGPAPWAAVRLRLAG